jgi:hypothetical protein
MVDSLRFDFEWESAPGVRDPILASTWARFGVSVGSHCLTEVVDVRAKGLRTAVYGPLFPLVEWLVENWWALLSEPAPRSGMPLGRHAAPRWASWVKRHNLLAAREGSALPDLSISRDGDHLLFQWDADPETPVSAPVRFVNKGTARLPAESFETEAERLVNAVVARLAERTPESGAFRKLEEAWNVIRVSDDSERELCTALAVLGVDPYDPDEATEELIALVERALRDLDPALCADLFEGTQARFLPTDLAWIESIKDRLVPGESKTFPTLRGLSGETPHELGYAAARRVRTEMLGLDDAEPIPDLAQRIERQLGWTSGCPERVLGAKGLQLEGLVGLEASTSTPRLFVGDDRSGRAERFRLARAAFFPVTDQLGSSGRLLSNAGTPLQRASRAFAAELLVPSAALARRIDGRVRDSQIEDWAEEFLVSSRVVEHQIENHRLAA